MSLKIAFRVLLLAFAASCFLGHAQAEKVLHINTSTEYEDLKAGKIGIGYDTVIVEATAHVNVLSRPKYFWSRPYKMIFRGVDGEISMHPKDQWVFGTFNSSSGLLYGLPLVFKDYNVEYHGDASTDGSDVFSITSWTQAERILINDGHDLTHRLLQHTEELKKLNQLKHLQLNIHRNTYKIVEVKKFIEALTKLESITFVTKRSGIALNEEEFKEFTQNQAIPDKWELAINDNGVVFKPKRSWFQKVVDFFKKIFG